MALVDRISKAFGSEIAVIPGSGMDMADFGRPKPFAEIGVSGLLRTKGVGYVYEEWLRELATHRQKQVYREMRDNDAVIGAMFFALEMILRKSEWRVEPAKKSGKEGDAAAQFVKECMDDMSHTWEDFISEIVSMFAFGFALFETTYKRRQGPKGKKASRFNDGKIGWRKFAPRAQESIMYWAWDDEGGLQGAVQLAAPDYKTILMPIERLLLFRTTQLKNNPEGRSLLRNCFRAWFFKRRIEEVEGIGIERDLCGLPILYVAQEALDAMGGIEKAKQIVRNVRVDDQAGIVLPIAFDEKGNKLVEFALLKAGGSKQTNPNEAIQRYNQDMLNTILAGFVQFGQSPTGSRSLHMSATQIFALALGAFMDSVSAVVNRIAIPRLFSLNGMDQELCPSLVPGEIGVRDLDELSSYVQRLSQSGLTFFDEDTSQYLRKIARLPEQTKESVALPGTQQPGVNPQQPGMPPQQRGRVNPNLNPDDKPEDDAEAAERLSEVG